MNHQTLPPSFRSEILAATGASSFEVVEELQQLWSGYGLILRLRLQGSEHQTAIAKFISFPTESNHPRGWDSSLSHQRKSTSYQVEKQWYQDWNSRCGDLCRTPSLIGSFQLGEQILLLLEDLDAAGFPARLTKVTPAQVQLCLRWLAEFHAQFLSDGTSEQIHPATRLWPVGTYWHLATRPGELAVLAKGDPALHAAASAIDHLLTNARYQTLVHGDAKLANFCFSPDHIAEVAALDFQYVGGGCGMKDVAYFLGSCLDETTIAREETQLLDSYFDYLTAALLRQNSSIDPRLVIAEWRALYPVAWTDFHRFLKGWSPTHWKLTSYSERLAQQVVASLGPLP